MEYHDFLELVRSVLENVSDFDLFDFISEYEKFLNDLKEKEKQD